MTSCYYYNTGKTAWNKDQNGATTSYFYIPNGGSANDPLDRLITTTFPTGGWTLNVFSTPPTTVDVYTGIRASSPTTSCTTAGSCRHDQTLLDGLARTTDQILVNDPDGLTKVHTDYDSSGRVLDTSHPYRTTSDSTYGFESPTYDGLNRTIQVQHQDGNKSHMYYGANVTTPGGFSTQQCSGICHLGYPTLTVDESGKMRQVWTDGFGNVVEVDEPNKSAAIGSFGTPTVAYYLYDPVKNLTQATIKNPDNSECSRNYAYDAMSRMLTSTEPEPGSGVCSSTNAHTTTYTYSVAGSLCSGNPSSVCTRLDARGITTTYSYNDGLNRLTGLSYNDHTTPTVAYSYDQTTYNGLTITNGLGRRTGMSDGSGQTAWSFDANGNVLTEKRTIASVTNTISYGYNKDNSLATIAYPSGRTISYTVGNAQRTISIADGNGTQYVQPPSSGWQYAPTGALWSAVYGKSGTFGGITENRSYNNRLQLSGVTASSSTGNALNLVPGYNANGEISGFTNSLDTGRTQSFTYDALSRILSGSSSAASGADCWGQNFTIDNVSNLNNIALSKCSGGTLSASVNQNNQFTSGFLYDNAGNLTNDGLYTYTYNGENEITTANGVTYTYDGNRMRTKKTGGMLFWRDTTGWTLTETNLSGSTTNEYVWFAGRRVARVDGSGAVYYYQTDQLGTTRVGENSSGTLCYDADYTPYGSEMTHTNSCPMNYKFTGYERDSETGLDYAVNRYYNPRLGRFMNPDPGGIGLANLANPQSLNQYAFVFNNPLDFTDPLGLEGVYSVMYRAGDCTWTGTGPFYYSGSEIINGVLTFTKTAYWNWNESCHTPDKKGTLACASEAASKVSIAGALHALGVPNSGVAGFVTDALGGNAFSGATDLFQSIGNGEAGGHSVFYNMGQGVAAGPSQGFSSVAKLAGKDLKDTPWESGPVDVATDAILATAQRAAAVASGSGRTIQTLSGVTKLGSVLGEAGEWASGFGEIKLGYDFLTWAGSVAGCAAGIIQ